MSTQFIQAYKAELEALCQEHWRKVVALERTYDAELQKFVARLEHSGIEVDTSEDNLIELAGIFDDDDGESLRDRAYSVENLTHAVELALEEAIEANDGSDLEPLLAGASVH